MGETSSPARRAYSGPAILAVGFRPFFLGAGLWAAGAVALWLAQLAGWPALPSAFDPIAWHAHEMLFGYVAAVIAGFLLTAIPNWTGRLPVCGRQLGLLFALWCAGRAAVGVSAWIGPATAAALDLAFPVALCAVVLREILAGGNWRNLPVAAILVVLAASNGLVHLEALGLAPVQGQGADLGADLGLRLGIAAVAVLIALVGGRVVPSFTRNWLAKRGEAVLPRSFGRLDRLAVAATVAAGLAWTFAPEAPASGALALLAAALGGARLAGWRGHRTLAEPLVWVLHLGYAWLVAGFALMGAAVLVPALPQSAALHALTAGAMGTMTLAIMTRATLGHSGRALTVGPGTATIYALVGAAALMRVLAPLTAIDAALLFGLSGLAWIGAFALFVVLYGPLLVGRRRA
jgi:uncharacterized protein involved in response to NO